MVLPDGDLWAAEKNILHKVSKQQAAYQVSVCIHLASSELSVFLLDLNLHDIARMLNDLGDECLMSSAYFSQDPLNEVNDPAVHPVLPENSGPGAERCYVRLDHTECSVYGPK